MAVDVAKIKHKRTNTPGKVPTTSDLEVGEILLNTADGKLFFKKDDNTIITLTFG